MRGEERIHTKGKKLVIVVCLNDFVHDCLNWMLLRKMGILSICTSSRQCPVNPAYSTSTLFPESTCHAQQGEIMMSQITHYCCEVSNQMVFYGVIGAEIRAYFRFIMENHGIKKQDIVRKYNISRASLYRILSNKKFCSKRNLHGHLAPWTSSKT